MISRELELEIINEACTQLGMDSDEVRPLLEFLIKEGYVRDLEDTV